MVRSAAGLSEGENEAAGVSSGADSSASEHPTDGKFNSFATVAEVHVIPASGSLAHISLGKPGQSAQDSHGTSFIGRQKPSLISVEALS